MSILTTRLVVASKSVHGMNTHFTQPNFLRTFPHLFRSGLWATVLCVLMFAIAQGNSTPTLSIDGKSVLAEDGTIRVLDDGVVLLSIQPIAQYFGGKLTIKSDTNTLLYVRPQDGAEFRIRLTDGLVVVNGKAIGYAQNPDRIDRSDWLLPSSIIEVLTGTHFKDAGKGRYSLKLDQRLQKVDGFRLILDGRRLPEVNEASFAVGATLVLPLATITRALGHTLTVDRVKEVISVRRAQDRKRLSLNLKTGVISVGDRPVGIAPNLSYANIQTLMLPRNAVEALTGTHISVDVKNRQINIALDDRLANAVVAGSRVQDVADKEPATLESIDYFVDSQSDNTLNINGRFRRYNLALRFETPVQHFDDPSPPPSWLSLDWRSVSGLSGSFGDALATRGELSGVDVSRVRGLSIEHKRTHGDIRAFVGNPLDGSRSLADSTAIPDFSNDVVAGIRYFPSHGDWDAGLSLRQSDLGGERLVLGVNGHNEWRENSQVPINTSYTLDAGVFERGITSTDVRGGANLSFDLGQQHITARTHYEGVGFASYNPRDVDSTGFDTIELSTGISRTFGTRFGTGLQLSARRNGIRVDRLLDIKTATLNTFWQPFADGPWLNFDYGQSRELHVETGRRKTTQAFIRSQYQIGRWKLEGALQYLRYDDLDPGSALSLSLTPDRWQTQLGSEATFAIGPRFGALFDDRGTRGSLGLLASFDAGRLLGDRLTASFDASYFDTDTRIRDALDTDPADNEQDSQALLTLTSGYRLSSELRIEASYTTDFDGRDRYGLALRGAHDINPVRRYRETRKHRGVLTGSVFIDDNGDGVRQPGESELPGVKVRIQGTQWQLRTNRNGDFTIQNLPEGLWRVGIDPRHLPLGYLLHPKAKNGVTIDEGRITHIELSVLRAGQIRGRLVEDVNADGVAGDDEPGLEGNEVVLMPEKVTVFTAAFGQFAFDRLLPGRYTLSVPGRAVNPVTVEIGNDNTRMKQIDIAVPPDSYRPQAPLPQSSGTTTGSVNTQ